MHFVGFYYKNKSRCTVPWMSNLETDCLLVCLQQPANGTSPRSEECNPRTPPPFAFQLSKIQLNINLPHELRSSKRFHSLKVFWIEICRRFSCTLDIIYSVSLLEVYVKSTVFLCHCQLANEQVCSVLVNYFFRIRYVYTKY